MQGSESNHTIIEHEDMAPDITMMKHDVDTDGHRNEDDKLLALKRSNLSYASSQIMMQ